MLLYRFSRIEEIRIVFAVNINANVSLTPCLHLVDHPNNIKVSKRTDNGHYLHYDGFLVKLCKGLMLISISDHILINAK